MFVRMRELNKQIKIKLFLNKGFKVQDDRQIKLLIVTSFDILKQITLQ